MRIGVIGGSAFPKDWNAWEGFERAHDLDVKASTLDDSELGEPSADLQGVLCGDSELLFLPRHGAEHHLLPAEINYRANLRLLADARVEAIVATHTVGGIASAIPVGGVVLPHQVIDYTWGREDTYAGNGEIIHVEFNEPFNRVLINNLVRVARNQKLLVVDGGVYACTQGPRFESPAEIDRFERAGATVVGMTAMPEAALAAELAVPYVSVSLVVNPAAGRGVIELEAIHEAGRQGMAQIQNLLRGLLQQGELLQQ